MNLYGRAAKTCRGEALLVQMILSDGDLASVNFCLMDLTTWKKLLLEI